MKHGSPSGYIYWKCKCDECRKANTKKSHKFRECQVAAATLGGNGRRYVENAPHGTPGGYTNYGCRCDECREAFYAGRE